MNKNMILEMDNQIKIRNEFKTIQKNKENNGTIVWNNDVIEWQDGSELLNKFLEYFYVEGKIDNIEISKLLNISVRRLQRYRKKWGLNQEKYDVKNIVYDLERIMKEVREESY